MDDNWQVAAYLGVAIILTLMYDIWRYAKFGRTATISYLIRGYAFDAHPLICVLIGMVLGGLVVHFFGFAP